MKQKIDEDIIRAALDTYQLERAVDPDKEAIEAALEAGFFEIERRVIERIATAAEELAAHIMDEEEPSEEGAAALEIFAYELRETIPTVDKDYIPQDDDIVEVTLVGEVTVFAQECPECGAEVEKFTWSVLDNATGTQYFFDPKEMKDNLRVRLVSRGLEDYLV